MQYAYFDSIWYSLWGIQHCNVAQYECPVCTFCTEMEQKYLLNLDRDTYTTTLLGYFHHIIVVLQIICYFRAFSYL